MQHVGIGHLVHNRLRTHQARELPAWAVGVRGVAVCVLARWQWKVREVGAAWLYSKSYVSPFHNPKEHEHVRSVVMSSCHLCAAVLGKPIGSLLEVATGGFHSLRVPVEMLCIQLIANNQPLHRPHVIDQLTFLHKSRLYPNSASWSACAKYAS